jgi:hypothetical protein
MSADDRGAAASAACASAICTSARWARTARGRARRAGASVAGASGATNRTRGRASRRAARTSHDRGASRVGGTAVALFTAGVIATRRNRQASGRNERQRPQSSSTRNHLLASITRAKHPATGPGIFASPCDFYRDERHATEREWFGFGRQAFAR